MKVQKNYIKEKLAYSKQNKVLVNSAKNFQGFF